jgi:hypothetical protein
MLAQSIGKHSAELVVWRLLLTALLQQQTETPVLLLALLNQMLVDLLVVSLEMHSGRLADKHLAAVQVLLLEDANLVLEL